MKELYKMLISTFITICYIINLIAMFFSEPIEILISNLIMLMFIIICPLIVLFLISFIDENDIKKF